MSKADQAVFAEALRLEPETRAELAAELLASLDGPQIPAPKQLGISRSSAESLRLKRERPNSNPGQ